jgi:hypothetical protein
MLEDDRTQEQLETHRNLYGKGQSKGKGCHTHIYVVDENHTSQNRINERILAEGQK